MPKLPHQIIRNLEGGIRIIGVDFCVGLVHPNDQRSIALSYLVGDQSGHQLGTFALTEDDQAPGDQMRLNRC